MSELSYSTMYKSVTDGGFVFFDKNFQSLHDRQVASRQPSNIQDERWFLVANSGPKLYFADSQSQYSFSKQQKKHMVPEPLPPYPSICGFFTICAVFIHSNSDKENSLSSRY